MTGNQKKNKFTPKIKRTLAERAGYFCSDPGCNKSTIGPHSDNDKSACEGEAAHIYGANPGSARYLASMTSEERSDISNGIWLCALCATKIDKDEKRYPVSELQHWKAQREFRQLLRDNSTADFPDIHFRLHCGVSTIRSYHPLIKGIPFLKHVLSDFGCGKIFIDIANKGNKRAGNIKLKIFPSELLENMSISDKNHPIRPDGFPSYNELKFEFNSLNRGEIRESADWFCFNIKQDLWNKCIMEISRKHSLRWELTCDDILPSKGVIRIT